METIEKLLGKLEARSHGLSAFHRHVRYLELSVINQFTLNMPCCAEPRDDPRVPYDFLFLDLAEMTNCCRMDIHIAARRSPGASKELSKHACLTELKSGQVEAIFTKLGAAIPHCEVTISTPLRRDVGPEQGYVEDVQLPCPRLHLWKRYTGDMFRVGANRVVIRRNR